MDNWRRVLKRILNVYLPEKNIICKLLFYFVNYSSKIWVRRTTNSRRCREEGKQIHILSINGGSITVNIENY